MKFDYYLGLEFIGIIAGCLVIGVIIALCSITLENFLKTYRSTCDKEKKRNITDCINRSIKYTYRLCRDTNWSQIFLHQSKGDTFTSADKNPESIIPKEIKELPPKKLKYSPNHFHPKRIISGGKDGNNQQ
jgi:hypothetical protein